MGKTADLFDAEGLEVGWNAPQVESDRVPAKAPAGEGEEAPSQGEEQGEGRFGACRRRIVASEGRRIARRGLKWSVSGEFHWLASEWPLRPFQRGGWARCRRRRVHSRRKRGGKTRVRAEEGGEVELLSAREAKRMEANPAQGRQALRRFALRGQGGAGERASA